MQNVYNSHTVDDHLRLNERFYEASGRDDMSADEDGIQRPRVTVSD